MNPFRRLVGLWRSRLTLDAFRYTAAIVASRIPAFLFLPVYASLLGMEEMGRYLTAIIMMDLIQTVSGMGMVQALFRFFPQAKGREERKAMLGTALLTGLIGGALVCGLLLCVFLFPPARDSLEILRSFKPHAFRLALAAGALINLMSILSAYVWAERKATAFIAALVTGALLEAALSLYMVATHHANLERILMIECIKDAAAVCALAWSARGDLSLRFSMPAFKTLFRFGIWLMPMGLSAWMFLSVDRFWLGQMAGLAEVGIYGFFYKFASPAAVLFQNYIISLDSHLFKSEGDDGRILLETSLARYLQAAGAVLVAAAILFPLAVSASTHFWKALPAGYLSGLEVYPLLLATTYIYFWAIHYGSMLEFQLRSKRQLAYMSVIALANFALCPAFIAIGGRMGLGAMASAALANLATASGFLGLQSNGSALRPARTHWKRALPVLALLSLIFLFWARCA